MIKFIQTFVCKTNIVKLMFATHMPHLHKRKQSQNRLFPQCF